MSPLFGKLTNSITNYIPNYNNNITLFIYSIFWIQSLWVSLEFLPPFDSWLGSYHYPPVGKGPCPEGPEPCICQRKYSNPSMWHVPWWCFPTPLGLDIVGPQVCQHAFRPRLLEAREKVGVVSHHEPQMEGAMGFCMVLAMKHAAHGELYNSGVTLVYIYMQPCQSSLW